MSVLVEVELGVAPPGLKAFESVMHRPGTSGSSSVPFRCLPARRNFSERWVRPSCFQMWLPALGFFPISSAQATLTSRSQA